MPKPKKYEYKGESLTIRELAAKHGINYGKLYQRIRKNDWKIEDHFLKDKLPFQPQSKIYVKDENGKKISLDEIALKNDLPYRNVYDRYKYGKRYRNPRKLGAPLYSL